jgi:hypothetical protein
LSQKHFSEIRPDERCLALVDTLCDRVEVCGYGESAACFMDQQRSCSGVSGITAMELEECRKDIRAMSCEGALPLSCQEIGDYAGAQATEPPQGSPSAREIEWKKLTQSRSSTMRPLG